MKRLVILFFSVLLLAGSCTKKNEAYNLPFLKKFKGVVKHSMAQGKEDPHIFYPYMVGSIKNLLNDSCQSFDNSTKYMIAAYIPKGMTLKVVCTGGTGTDLQGGGNWIMEKEGWTITSNHPISFTYEAIGEDKIVKVPFMSTIKKTFDFTIYENGVSSAAKIRSVPCQ